MKEWKDKETEQRKLLGENGADPQITNTSLQGEAPGSHSQLSRLTDLMKEKQLSSMGPNKTTRPLHTRAQCEGPLLQASPSITSREESEEGYVSLPFTFTGPGAEQGWPSPWAQP